MPRTMDVAEPGFRYHSQPARGTSASFLHCAWAMQAARCRTAIEAALPDACIDLYFNFGPVGRHLVAPDAMLASRARRDAWVVGPHVDVLLFAKEVVACDIVAVRLLPGVARAVLGVPAHELTGRVVDLEHFWDDVEGVRDRLSCQPDVTRRLAMLEQELARRALRVPLDPSHDLIRVAEGNGDMAISSIARRFGMTHRRVISVFRDTVGLKPKEFQRVHRLRRVLERLPDPGLDRWGPLAYEFGYSDQAHMANEFRALTGLTIGEYRRAKASVGVGFYSYRLHAGIGG